MYIFALRCQKMEGGADLPPPRAQRVKLLFLHEGKAHSTHSEKIIKLLRSFISEAGFNLIYICPEVGSEPEKTKPDSSTSM